MYVNGGGTACRTAPVPDWQVHFTTTDAQQGQGQYVVLSVGLAATESNLTVSLNGHPLTWAAYDTLTKRSDAAVRSGFSGTYQWGVFQWDKGALNAPGADNVLTFHVNRTQGDMYDALRLEITNNSADPALTGWNDYAYVDCTVEDGERRGSGSVKLRAGCPHQGIRPFCACSGRKRSVDRNAIEVPIDGGVYPRVMLCVLAWDDAPTRNGLGSRNGARFGEGSDPLWGKIRQGFPWAKWNCEGSARSVG
jgi:hypothetical protein